MTKLVQNTRAAEEFQSGEVILVLVDCYSVQISKRINCKSKNVFKEWES